MIQAHLKPPYKSIYFVRHGITSASEQKTQQNHHKEELSQRGKNQAIEVAEYFKDKELDLLASSSSLHAFQTADIIKTVIHFEGEIIISDLFKDIARPTALTNLRLEDPAYIRITRLIKKNMHIGNWKLSDEEAFLEMCKRAKDALNYIQRRQKKNILIISHATFMTCMIYILIFGANVDRTLFLKFRKNLKFGNAGIIKMENWDKKSWLLAEIKNLY